MLYPGWVSLLDYDTESAWRSGKEQRIYSVQQPTETELLYYMKNFPISGTRKATVVFSISSDYIRTLLSQQIGNAKYQVTLYNPLGECLLTTEMAPVPFDILADALKTADESAVSFQRDGLIITAAASESGNLIFSFSMPRSLYFRNTDMIRMQILVLTGVALFMVLVSALLVSRRMYSPIHTIAVAANRALQRLGGEQKQSADAYSNIHGALDMLSGKVDSLHEQLGSTYPALRSGFYHDMLYKVGMDTHAIDERIALLQIPAFTNYRVAIIKIAWSSFDIRLMELFKMALVEYIQLYAGPGLYTFAMVSEYDTILAVAGYDDEEPFLDLMAHMHEQLQMEEHRQGMMAHLAYGSSVEDIRGLHLSFQDARRALAYAFLRPDDILAHDIYSAWEHSAEASRLTEMEAIQALIGQLDTQSAAAYCEALRAELTSKPYSYQYLRYALQHVLTLCLACAKERGIFIDVATERALFAGYAQTQTLDEYMTLLRNLLNEMIARMEKRKSNAGYDLIASVQNYIQTHLTEELSLGALAERFHISYSHLSKTFRDITGMKYTEFVLQCRLEEAIRLLVETDMTVESIAQHVAIYNTGYFIRAFKARYGVTPKQYRMSHASDADGENAYHFR